MHPSEAGSSGKRAITKCTPGYGSFFQSKQALPLLHLARYHRDMDTLALNPDTWDLTIDAYGNLATFGDATPTVQTGPGMRLAQDVATRCRAWRGEVYFDTTQGIRYETILGAAPNLSVLQNSFNTEALKVPLCETAIAVFAFAAGSARTITGTLNVADVSGTPATISIV